MKITIQDVLNAIPKHIKEKMIPVTINKGEFVIEKNGEVNHGYIFTQGVIDVMHVNSKEVVYTYIKNYACHLVGLMEIYSENKYYCCTCRVDETCVGYKLSRECFGDLLEECDVFKKYVVAYWAQQFYESAMNASRYPNNATRQKLIDYLLQKCSLEKAQLATELRVTRDDLAEFMGCSKRTVYRLLNGLEEEGYLSKKGHMLLISPSQKKKMFKEYERNNQR